MMKKAITKLLALALYAVLLASTLAACGGGNSNESSSSESKNGNNSSSGGSGSNSSESNSGDAGLFSGGLLGGDDTPVVKNPPPIDIPAAPASDFEYSYNASLGGVEITKYIGTPIKVHIPALACMYFLRRAEPPAMTPKLDGTLTTRIDSQTLCFQNQEIAWRVCVIGIK